MGAQPSNERHHESSDEPEEKLQKFDEHGEQLANIVEAKPGAKTITSIHYDCLERIFDYLDLESLLNDRCSCKIW